MNRSNAGDRGVELAPITRMTSANSVTTAAARTGANGWQSAGIRVDAGRAMAPEVARAVVESGADLLELRIDEKSLEEVFFEMTKQQSSK